MNLQTTLVKATPFPFGFGNLRTEEVWQPRKDYTEQKLKTLENETSELKHKDNLVLSREAIVIIGANGKRRFDEFKGYPNGWYGGKGKQISRGSVFVFEQFVRNLPELKPLSPSLFFTFAGNLQIGFEDKERNIVEIEFFPDKIEFYLESLEEESFIKLADVDILVKKVKNLLK